MCEDLGKKTLKSLISTQINVQITYKSGIWCSSEGLYNIFYRLLFSQTPLLKKEGLKTKDLTEEIKTKDSAQ